MKAYTMSKKRGTWIRSEDLDNLNLIEMITAKFSAWIHDAQVKWSY